jgi:prefoldin subunit 5
VNIDERLEKLAQRHEALTQTVEIIARGMQGLQTSVAGMQSYIKDIAEATARLLHIAQIHEHRITRLEEDGSTD